MKKGKLFSTVSILGLMAVGAYLSSQNYSVGISEAIAETDDALLNTNCTAATPAAYTPDLNYTFVANAPTRGSTPTLANANIAYNGPTAVNGESAPMIGGGGQTYFSSGPDAGSVLVTHSAAKSKISGLLCTNNSQSSLLAQAKVSDNSSALKIAAQTVTDPDNVWKAANRLDNDLVGKMLFGAASALGHNSPITDGGDAETQNNGEVVFGTIDPAKGGYEMQLLLKVQGGSITNQSEELTMVFTPS